MPARFPPLTVPALLLLLTAGGMVMTTIRSYPAPAPEVRMNSRQPQQGFNKPSQSLHDLFDAIGGHPDRLPTEDYNYCQANRPSKETYLSLKQKDAVLVSSQLFVRHGDRTPTEALPLDVDLHWECADLSAFSFTGPRTNHNETDPFQYAHVVAHQVVTIPTTQQRSPFAHKMWKGTCAPGQLTPLGAWQHRQLGAALRELYVDQLKFLPPTFDPLTVYIRSTDVWRTKQSAENLMAGLYDTSVGSSSSLISSPERQNHPPVLQVHTVPVEIDYLTLNRNACPRLAQLQDEAAKTSPVLKQIQHDNAKFSKKLSDLLGSERSSWTRYMDTILPRVCHRHPLQCKAKNNYNYNDNDGDDDDDNDFSKGCVTHATAARILKNVAIHTAEMYRDGKGIFDVLQMGIGPLAQEIKHNLLAAKDGSSKVLLRLYSGHDTTLTPLLGMLDSADMRWPPYASNMLVELWKTKEDGGKHFVRVIYNNKVVETRSEWCDLSWCPLETFTAYMDKFFVPDLESACQAL
ncbi:hypothetical protein BG004_003977 [Podila humilis]|nr:hypothetical protein BG004_003977 [Podila humilis]